ncbi:unnamed protein product, partial [Phaeothamnion confervicola]
NAQQESPPPVGLRNQGNTCYLNSLLQTIYAAPDFRDAVANAGAGRRGGVFQALQTVFSDLNAGGGGGGRGASTAPLTSAMRVDVRVQQDAHEFGRFLLMNIEAEAEDGAAPAGAVTAVRRLFVGQLANFLSCVDVPFEKEWKEDFFDVSLDVKGCRDLKAALNRYTEPELLSGENRWKTASHGLQDALKGVRFLALPPVLQFHLKRFEYDPYSDNMAKLNDRFEFPAELDVSPWLEADPATIAADAGEGMGGVGSISGGSSRYHLNAVLMHVGGPLAGHYFAYVRRAAAEALGGTAVAAAAGGGSSQWFRVDDDRVAAVSEADVLRDAYGGGGGGRTTGGRSSLLEQVLGIGAGGGTPSAYIVQYVREEGSG